MMQVVLHSLLGFLIITFGISIFFAFRNVTEYKEEMKSLFITALIAIILYFLVVTTSSYQIAKLAAGLYFGMLEWVLYRMFEYTIHYTNIHIYPSFLCGLLKMLAIISSTAFVINFYVVSFFQMERSFYKDSDILYWSVSYYRPFLFHLGICYCLVAFIVVLFIKKIKQSPKAYKKMYLNILGCFILIIASNLWCYSQDFYFDFTVLIYPVLAVTIYHYTYYAVPKGLREDTMVQVVADIHSSIFCFDVNGKCRYINKNAKQLVGKTEKEAFLEVEAYQKKWIIEHPVNGENQQLFKDVVFFIRGEEKHFHVEYQKLTDQKNRVIGFFYKLQDCTEEVELYKKEQYHATHDLLTGLYNREFFFQEVERIIKEDPYTERYMVCTNIKNFKLVNELFGEQMGDTVLLEQAKAFMLADYDSCIHGRISADRFAMLIQKKHFNPEMGARNTSRLQNLLSEYNFPLRILIGVYDIKDVNESAKVMYDKANLALSQIDAHYEKMFVFYDEIIMDKLIRERDILNSFEQALEKHELCMYLQPQVNQHEQVIGCEAVVRWNHPEKGLIYPNEFIDVLEKTGAVLKLDQFILEEAVMKLVEWKRMGIEDFSISANLSSVDFFSMDMYQYLIALVTKYGISAKNLKLEITEKLFMNDIERHMNVIKKLQDFGFSIELDDFGSGFTSFNLLKDLNIDKLKIDMVFIHQSTYEERREIILESICEMAAGLNIPLIMEGVQNEEQFTKIKQLGCQYFQGSYFSLPIPVVEFENRFLLSH